MAFVASKSEMESMNRATDLIKQELNIKKLVIFDENLNVQGIF